LTLKPAALVAVPLGAITLMCPLVAPGGTVAVIDVDEFTVKLAEAPANWTAVAPEKFVPVIVTIAPTLPLVGANAVIVGGAWAPALKIPALTAVPPEVVTLIGPLVAPTGTVAVIDVDEFTVKLAAVPLNLTAVAPVKFVPAMATLSPGTPLRGEKPATVGGALTNVRTHELDALLHSCCR
jgi:hypothetical protein